LTDHFLKRILSNFLWTPLYLNVTSKKSERASQCTGRGGGSKTIIKSTSVPTAQASSLISLSIRRSIFSYSKAGQTNGICCYLRRMERDFFAATTNGIDLSPESRTE
jgi:hypothetical protein